MSTDNDYYEPEMADIDIRDDLLRRECWRRAACPVCGKEYLHLVQYKPETCQEIECIHELRRRKGGIENEDNGGM